MKKIISLGFCLILAFPSVANILPVELFSKKSQFSQLKISPKGTYFSAITQEAPGKEGKNTLIIFDRKTLKPIHTVFFQANAQVGNYQWSSDSRVVLEKEYIQGWHDHPRSQGELFAVNADGTKPQYVVGHEPEQQLGSNIKKREALRAFSKILDPLINDDKHILISSHPWSGEYKESETYVDVYKVNTFNGKLKKITRAPAQMAQYLTDRQGNVRLATASKDYIYSDLYILDQKSDTWQLNQSIAKGMRNLQPLSFDLSGDNILALASKEGEPEGLYKINLASGESQLLSQHDHVSPSRVWIDDTNKEVFAVEYEAGYPTYEFINQDSAMTARLKALLAYFPNQQVRIVSSSKNNKASIVAVFSDTNPAEFYLFDAEKNKISFLAKAFAEITPEQMNTVLPINYKARDGLTIYGYLTLPKGKETKNLPLVVMPHGGPHGPRDYWGFDATAQLLANRGMAVLQVNFRGSGGFGSNFEAAGYQKWGAEIQFDILDGVQHLISQGTVNKDNMCMMGASFGGYSALQSAILSPNLFKCAIGVVGVYDLPLMFKEGDIAENKAGINYLTAVLGQDTQQLQAFSPSYNIDKLTAPVLIVHGGEDKRAPLEQADSLIAAMKKHNHPYEYLLLEDEGHGFYLAKHRQKYFETVLAFLDKHLTL